MWAGGIASTVSFALALFLGFFLLRVLLRRTWLAVVVVMLLGLIPVGVVRTTGLGSSIPWIAMVSTGLLLGITMFSLVRFGVLTVVVSLALNVSVLAESALGTDLSAWYAPTMYLAAGIVAALALWCFRYALAGRAVWKGDLLET